jgi:hypothetical protein
MENRKRRGDYCPDRIDVNTERRGTEKNEERKIVVPDRKSPLLETKGGAPSTSFVR